jgi:hypothetical protein
MCYSNLYVQEVKTGPTPTDVELYMQGHRGSDPQNPDVLCTQTASDRLVSFWYSSMCLLMMHLYLVCLPLDFIWEDMVQLHGQDYDWRSQPIDPQVAYAIPGGQAHGR